jgi:hypothetical protein
MLVKHHRPLLITRSIANPRVHLRTKPKSSTSTDRKRLTVFAAHPYHRFLQVRLENSPIETRTEA